MTIYDIRIKLIPNNIINSDLYISDVTNSVISQEIATQTLLLGQELERQRLDEEIHDDIAPSLSMIQHKVENLRKSYSGDNGLNELSDIEGMFKTLQRDLRRVSHALMTASLKDFGLVSAIKNMIKELNKIEQIPIYFSTNLKDKDLTEVYEHNLFRISQELVHNAIQYSKSEEIQLLLHKRGEKIQLNIEDDGVGADLNENKSGIGLHNIKTRVASFTWHS